MPYEFGIRSYFSPSDDIQSQIITEVQAAQTSILMAIYGFHLPQLTQLLIDKHRQGVKVICVLDLTQSKGKAETAEVKKLIAAGVDVAIGTSPKAGAIMHEKGLCIDGIMTLTGSYNFSLSAANQVNHMDFVFSPDRAAWFTKFFNGLRDWILKNEPHYQLKK